MARDSHINEGRISGLIGIKGQPTAAEAVHVARDILLAEYLDLPIHLAHISCRQSVELIVWAKSRGVKISAETCPHYLHFTEDLLAGYDTAAKVNPPLRTAADAAYLRSALADGVFDMLVTDHAPHAPHEKEAPLDQAPCGIMGLETALPLSYALVRDNVISEKQLISLWSTGPARVFKLPGNAMNIGDPADFALFDPELEWRVDESTVKTKGRNTPLWGKSVRGKVVANWVGGVSLV
jgi:dihydroorotase